MPEVTDITVLIAQIQTWKIQHVRFAVVSKHYRRPFSEFADFSISVQGVALAHRLPTTRLPNFGHAAATMGENQIAP